MDLNYILYAIPFFFLLIFLEWFYGFIRKKKFYRFNDAITNLNIGVGSQAAGLFFKFILLGAYMLIYEHWAFFYQQPGVLSTIVCVVAFDFLYYWAHRWSHEINFLWGAHVVHHSSEEYNLSVALRQSWIHNLLAFFIFLPLPFFGFDPIVFFAAAGFITLYQFWIHTRAIDKLPSWVEFIFNTPSHHRVHHGVNPQYIDKNHAAFLIIWDRFFGTFQEEAEEPEYGITSPIKSWNPLWANLHYYKEMWDVGKKMTNWRDRFRLIFAAPGWRPDYLGGKIPIPKLSEKPQDKFNKKADKPMHAYIVLQFTIIIWGIVSFMAFYEGMTTFYKVFFFVLLVLSMVICGGILERKEWVKYGELIRLVMVASSLNIFYYQWYTDWFIVMLLASVFSLLVSGVWFVLGYLRPGRLSHH